MTVGAGDGCEAMTLSLDEAARPIARVLTRHSVSLVLADFDKWHPLPGVVPGPSRASLSIAQRTIYAHDLPRVDDKDDWLDWQGAIVHELAHILAARGETVQERETSVEDDDEDEVLIVEALLWRSLGKSLRWVARRWDAWDYGYECVAIWVLTGDSRDIRTEVRELRRRGVLTPKRLAVRACGR